MIRSLPSLILAVALLSACRSVGGPITPRPSYPPPSNACGGFHLLVINNDAYAVGVKINETDAGNVEANGQVMLVPLFRPELPPFPWTVGLSRADDGTWVGTAGLETGVGDTKITVSGGQINVANMDLASTGCGGRLDSRS